jgi:hypothetical protein
VRNPVEIQPGIIFVLSSSFISFLVENFATAGYHGNEFEMIPQIIVTASTVQLAFLLYPSI